ncbi:magnesium transporter [Limnoglobus roseus]|uniref:Magnesium transporter MgtE n=1 Tax=Limnoglobus roseus TaxID=2598579 RepID=A0A5C1AQK8_9BACT|nr:magnesium transporter [Limnoglobus roseus]QEL20316.1 magnesium transporter [Limnoglobus roseus]
MPDPLFTPEVRLMLEEQDADGLRAICEDLHPATMAGVLDGFPPEQLWDILGHADVRKQASIFEYLPHPLQEEMLSVDRPQAGAIIGKMSHDDRVDIMRRVPAEVRERLLRVVDEAERKDIATLVEYGFNTVGAIMTTDYAWLPPHLNAFEAIEQLRQQAPDRETIYYIYVLDELVRRENGGKWSRKLLGAISLRDLILAPKGALIRDMMSDEIVSLKYDDPAEKAGQILARYDFIAIPVLDPDGGMLGIVTHDDVIDVIQEEATEDLQRQGGVSPLGESYMDASFFKIWRSRAFWLSLLFVAELATFSVMSYFEDAIATVVVLSLFVPLCISTGGNSGSQASTLITRALALGEIQLSDWKRLLRRELLMGLALGVTLGVIAFFRGALTPDDTRGGPRKEAEPFTVRVDAPLVQDGKGDYVVPEKSILSRSTDRPGYVRLPKSGTPPSQRTEGSAKVYDFPAECEIRTEAVSAWKLGQVIAISVLGICIWGTLVGATLPLVFRRYGLDPAIASGPFVATFVDVTGIFIFFSVASWLLL